MAEETVETKIKQAIKAKIISLTSDYPFWWPAETGDKPFDPTGLKVFVEVRYLPLPPVRLLIGSNGAQERSGNLRLSLFFPVSIPHSDDMMSQKAGEIAAQFKLDDHLDYKDVRLRIYEAPSLVTGFRNNAYWQYPVTIPWRTYA